MVLFYVELILMRLFMMLSELFSNEVLDEMEFSDK